TESLKAHHLPWATHHVAQFYFQKQLGKWVQTKYCMNYPFLDDNKFINKITTLGSECFDQHPDNQS
ncbi:2194_t:CDS:2, partial [Entrophospora sp. SA101]